ncbi:hypothetical protein [Rhodococcus wratislaviensis]|jgi:hypothetical protein|uniref:Lipoprotein n=1 Tax=Rhodococcus wratislaviensis NBRC 100605 TaxID=1219028 RepID=X0QYL1_RHOWR|nr:hypothetical protein [Rhodococcus wratislaviensis]GAF43705.1 hypothetical protein RW1_009_01290 [Rhodococcus wratislaviensis NBRC 100605]
MRQPKAGTTSSKAVRTATWAALLSVAVSCGTTPDHPGAILDDLPPGAVGAVSLGPQGLESTGGRAIVFVFDEGGNVLGRLEDEPIYANPVLASKQSLVTASGRAVTTLTSTSRIDVPVDEGIVEAAANNPETGSATVWFNSGRTSNFVSVDADGQTRTGSVQGMVRTATYCGDRQFAVVRDIIPTGEMTKHRLYELPPGGGLVVRGEWDLPVGVGPASRNPACAADGQSILALWRMPDLALVRIDVSDGSQSETVLDMPGFAQNAWGTTAVVGDRLYWLNQDGQVLSVSTTGPSAVALEWAIPDPDKTTTTVSGTTVTVVNYRGRPVFSQHDLITGNQTRDPIELPWLESIVGSPAGNTLYSIADVTTLEEQPQ